MAAKKTSVAELQALLSAVGMTPEQLQAQLIDKLADKILYTGIDDPDGPWPSKLSAELHQAIERRLSSMIDQVVEEKVGVDAVEYIRNVRITPTSRYGEKKGDPQTILEFLSDRASGYLSEAVDTNGKSQVETSGYTFTPSCTRAEYILRRFAGLHLKNAAVVAFNEPLKQVAEVMEKAATDAIKTVFNAKSKASC